MYKNMNEAYCDLASAIQKDGALVRNTIELNNVKFTIAPDGNMISSCRDMSLAYLLGEFLWYYTYRNDVEFISKFSKLWKRISDDGRTNNSAYGYILFKKYGFDQIHTAVNLLKEDPESRRAVVNINVPNAEVLTTKDEPCTIALQFYIRHEQLCCTAIMRSCDMWFGLPYDVVFFQSLQQLVALCLDIPVGPYTHFAVSLHIYTKDLEKMTSLDPRAPKVCFDALKLISTAPELAKWVDRYAQDDLKQAIVQKAKELDILDLTVTED